MKKQLNIVLLALFLCAFFAYSAGAEGFPANSSYKLAYSPGGNALQLITSAVDQAETSILVAAYTFTSKPIAVALLAAQKRGVKVMVVADAKSNTGRYSAITFLANQGVPVWLNDRHAIMHNKFMVVDAKHVQTGSFNYSAAAVSRNAENVLVIFDAPALASEYTEQWQRLWLEGKELKQSY